MRALERKLRRDLVRLRSQILSIAAVVACGVGSVLAMRTTLQSMQRSRAAYYESARMPDVFASLTRAPLALARRIEAIPGVATAETRVVENVVVTVRGLAETAVGHIVSIPPSGQPLLATLYVRQGRMPASGRADEVLINEHFARENRLVPGDTVVAILNGRRARLHVVGIGLSPEFIHDAVPGSGFFNDSRHTAIIWMRRDAVAPQFRMDGAFNDVVVRLGAGASEASVIAELDRLLAPWGGGHAYGRKDQASNRVLDGEIEQLRVFGTAMPVIFLFVAAFLLNVVLARLVATQREEIATLKAFGYTNAVIARHYLGYPAAAIALGSVGGIALGTWVGSKYTALYAAFFRLPSFEHYTSPSLVAVAIFVSAIAAVTGALAAVRVAVALPPAEGMRPPNPPTYHRLALERIGWVRLVPPAARMILRDLERRPLRTLASIVGVALAASILVVGTFAFDTVNYMMHVQFTIAEREDLSVSFDGPVPWRARHALASVHGITRVEPFRAVAVRIANGHRSRLVSITGLQRGGQLRRLVDGDGHAYELPPGGVVLARGLATILRVKVGDTVAVSLLERGNEIERVAVVGLLDELIGLGAYMDIDALARLLNEGRTMNGAYLGIAPGHLADVTHRLTDIPRVSGTVARAAMVASFDARMAESIRLTVTIVVSLACVVALGVVYNGNRIALSERARELASLRVLGFTRREVATLLFGEQGAINAVGIPGGLLLGFVLALWVATGFSSEMYRFPVIVGGSTYLLATMVVVAAFVLASIPMKRRVDRLDLIAVLKTRE